MNYNNKKFKAISNSENGEVPSDMIFHYQQKGNILSCNYRGGTIIQGHLLGQVDEQGNIDMRYHQINSQGELMTGICKSKPKIGEDGKLTLFENWQWTSGNQSKGQSILKEI